MAGRRDSVSQEKKERITQLLKTTDLDFVCIATRVGVSDTAVAKVNRAVGARPVGTPANRNRFWEY